MTIYMRIPEAGNVFKGPFRGWTELLPTSGMTSSTAANWVEDSNVEHQFFVRIKFDFVGYHLTKAGALGESIRAVPIVKCGKNNQVLGRLTLSNVFVYTQNVRNGDSGSLEVRATMQGYMTSPSGQFRLLYSGPRAA